MKPILDELDALEHSLRTAVDLLAKAAPMLSDRGRLNDDVKAFLTSIGRKT